MGFPSGVKPKRSLGQNFFINQKLIEKIVAIVLESNPEHITEIGAGRGAFTKCFYSTPVDLTLIEKDYTLAQILRNNYKDIEICNIDFSDYKLEKLNTTYFGSLPFNVARDILHKIITSYTFNNESFFIIQKEMAEKYQNKFCNPLGLIREIYADFKTHFDIKPGNFKPKPKVISSFVSFTPHNRYTDIDKTALEDVIKNSFKSPRKTLKNNLKSNKYNLPKSLESKRAAELTLAEYISILEHS